jgi:hypothetical protein
MSTLSACYWRQGKIAESIGYMHAELELATSHASNNQIDDIRNKYRIYGNLANAYQHLNNQIECLNYLQLQLNCTLAIGDRVLQINTLNTIGHFYLKCDGFGDNFGVYTKSLEYYTKSLAIIDQLSQTENEMSLSLSKIRVKQLGLIGDCYFQVNNYIDARAYFLKQLDAIRELLEKQTLAICNDSLEEHVEFSREETEQYLSFQECLNLLNLAIVAAKMKNNPESVIFYEKCLNNLQLNFNLSKLAMEDDSSNLVIASYQQILELYGRVHIGLINNFLYAKENLKASLYAHAMLNFTLEELARLNNNKRGSHSSRDIDRISLERCEGDNIQSEMAQTIIKRKEQQYKRCFRYLKFIEMIACSKLAICYARQERLLDAFKLHEREAALALKLTQPLHLSRAYSYMAQIHFINKEYEKSLDLYKRILSNIELSLTSNSEKLGGRRMPG